MSYWLLLADPKSYGYGDLEKDKKTIWDGVTGSVAQKRMRSFVKGDRALVYHTAPEKAVVGTAEIVTDPYPDPEDKSGSRVVVDLHAQKRLKRPVSLQALKDNKNLSDMTFLKIQRIAVFPLSRSEFDEIKKMGS